MKGLQAQNVRERATYRQMPNSKHGDDSTAAADAGAERDFLQPVMFSDKENMKYRLRTKEERCVETGQQLNREK